MRNLLLASATALALAALPAMADSLTETTGGADAALGAPAEAPAPAGTGAAVETGAGSEPLPPPASVLPDSATTAAAAAGNAAAATAAAIDGAALIGKTVLDAEGEAIGTVSNAVLAPGGDATEKLVIESGGFFGFGAREVAIDASNVDASAASDGEVRLIGLTAGDLEMRRAFEADGSMRLANPS